MSQPYDATLTEEPLGQPLLSDGLGMTLRDAQAARQYRSLWGMPGGSSGNTGWPWPGWLCC